MIPDIPSTLPVLPLRDVVIFPHMIFPVLVGRESSIKAVNTAILAVNPDKWARYGGDAWDQSWKRMEASNKIFKRQEVTPMVPRRMVRTPPSTRPPGQPA